MIIPQKILISISTFAGRVWPDGAANEGEGGGPQAEHGTVSGENQSRARSTSTRFETSDGQR